MNRDFIQVKGLEGELKFSHKTYDYGMTVSTKELIFQKPHANYHIPFSQILSIMPFDPVGKRTIKLYSHSPMGSEVSNVSLNVKHYRLFVNEAALHNRSGIFTLKKTEFILPFGPELLRVIAEHSGMSIFS